jgi:HNH endonuclease
MTKSRHILKPRRYWSQGELETLRKLYPSRPTAEIAKQLGRSARGVYVAALKNGLRKLPEYLKTIGIQKGSGIGSQYRFGKGHVPANKGTRRPGFSPGRMKETQFKKGQRSGKAALNWKPVGTILKDPEGYLRIKVREAVHKKEPTGFGNSKVWQMYNRWLWEKHKGPIPPKHLVIFKDGRRENCVIKNLKLLSMANNARRNTIWRRYPRELAEAIQLGGALKRKIRRLQNGKE